MGGLGLGVVLGFLLGILRFVNKYGLGSSYSICIGAHYFLLKTKICD